MFVHAIDSKTSYQNSQGSKENLRLRKPKDMVRLLTMENEPTNIHQRIKHKRLLEGLSQTKLAMRVGVSRAAVSQWESEEGENSTSPDGENLVKCAKALNTTPNYLLYGVEDKEAFNNIPGAIQLEYKLLPILTDNDMIELSKTGQLINYGRTIMVMQHHLKTTESMFGYEIVSDAMIHPTNRDLSLFIGETAIFDKDLQPKSGDIVYAVLGSDNVKLRQLIIDGADSSLKAYNSNHPRIDIDLKKDKIVGTFVGIQPKMRLVR